jgi:hypothetical protein
MLQRRRDFISAEADVELVISKRARYIVFERFLRRSPGRSFQMSSTRRRHPPREEATTRRTPYNKGASGDGQSVISTSKHIQASGGF